MKDIGFFFKLKAFLICALFATLITITYIVLNTWIFIKENIIDKIYNKENNRNGYNSTRINQGNKFK